MMNRREFVYTATSASAALIIHMARAAAPSWTVYPFSLGVASGEPEPTSIVLWTRLATHPTEINYGLTSEIVPVQWEISEDESMRKIVQRGITHAEPAFAHSVHIEVQGLKPGSWYWYRFHAGSATSPIGRTRTAPPADAMPEKFNFCFVSCQKYENGYYTGFEHMSRESPDLIVHLGDYIYEKGVHAVDALHLPDRLHPKDLCVNLDQYRLRYALYKTDPMLQKAHLVAPWIVTPDDHEVSNNYAGDIDEYGTPIPVFLKQRAAAYRAYYEHMPLRRSSLPQGASAQIYRALHFGQLASFYVLDTRQFRSDQPCGDDVKPVCEGALSPQQTMMGHIQEEWLFRNFSRSTSRWNVLAQQILMAEVNRNPMGHPVLESMDKWDGYHAARNRLYRNIADCKLRNPVVISGDIHLNFANHLRPGLDEDKSAIGVEFAGTSITSGGNGCDVSDEAKRWLNYNPNVKFFNEQRGYVRCEITPKFWRSDYRVLDFIDRHGGAISTRASFVVEDGKPELQRNSVAVSVTNDDHRPNHVSI
jgi:alkaline phosphatase D